MSERILFTEWESPCGTLVLAGLNDRLVMSDWKNGWHHEAILKRFAKMTKCPFVQGTSSVIAETISQLQEYFALKRQRFDLPLLFIGTDFQKKVWRALESIEYGKVVSYGDIARTIDNPQAVRAVGGAVGQNPFSIIVPCHRIVGSNNSLTGYGGGFEAKKYLLTLESKNSKEPLQLMFS